MGIFDNTMVVLCSDHGEAFGEHGLYLHDASVYNTHLHVPLWIFGAGIVPRVVEDVVSTRDLFGIVLRAAKGNVQDDTILNAGYRSRECIARAEHIPYPHLKSAAAKYRHHRYATVSRNTKVVACDRKLAMFDLESDPSEERPIEVSLSDVVRRWEAEGAGAKAVTSSAGFLRQAI